MSGGGGGQAGGQQQGWTESPWLGPSIGAAGLGLALAGRRGSPASGLGTGILAQLASTYAERGITAEERRRKMEQEDETRRLRFAEVMMNSGAMRPVRTGEQPLERLNFAGREIGLVPTERLNPLQYATGLGTALGLTPEEVSGGLGQLSGTPEQQIAQMQALIPQLAQRKRERMAGPMFSGLARPVRESSLAGGFEQPEGPTREPTTIQPGVPGILRPREASALSAIASMPGGYDTAMRELAQIITQRARQTDPEELSAMLDQARGILGAGGARNLSLSVHGGPQGTTFGLTEKPEDWRQQQALKGEADTKAEAQEILTSPRWKDTIAALQQSKDRTHASALQELDRARRTGDSSGLTNFHNLIKPKEEIPPDQFERTVQAMNRAQPGSGDRLRVMKARKEAGEITQQQWLMDYSQNLRALLNSGSLSNDEAKEMTRQLTEVTRQMAGVLGIKQPSTAKRDLVEQGKREGWTPEVMQQKLNELRQRESGQGD